MEKMFFFLQELELGKRSHIQLQQLKNCGEILTSQTARKQLFLYPFHVAHVYWF